MLLAILSLCMVGCDSSKKNPTKLSYHWWNPDYDPNFDERSRWMKGVIFGGSTGNPVGYSEHNHDYYYRDYIENGIFKEDKRWRKLYTLDSSKDVYEYTPMNDTTLLYKLVGITK